MVFSFYARARISYADRLGRSLALPAALAHVLRSPVYARWMT